MLTDLMKTKIVCGKSVKESNNLHSKIILEYDSFH